MTALHGAPRHGDADARRYLAEGLWNDDTLATYLERWARQTPERPAIVDGARRLGYAETFAAARRLANALRALGLGKGDVVGIQLPNVPEYLIAYFGVTMMGGVLGTLHMPYRAGELAPLMNHGHMRALICGPATERYDAPATGLALKSRVPSLEHVIADGDGPPPEGCHALRRLIAEGADREVPDPPGPDDPALLCFTSGTAAAPKAVLRSYRTIAANARIYSPTIALTAEDVVMTAPPFTHVFGLCCVNCTLCVGATNLLMPLFTPEDYARRIHEGRPTVLFSVPAHVAATHKAGLLDTHDMSSIREVVVAGSVCPPEVAAAFERYLPNGRVGQLFGMTEVILVMQTPLEAGPEVRHRSTGRATRGIEARVAGYDGAVLGAGEEGELQIRGYSVFAGYLGNEEANRAAFTDDGFFRTGDLATIDADGNVVITGRVKDVINRGGIKINPTDVENLVAAHDKVIQAAIVPMPDDVLGEKGCLFVTLVPGATLSLAEVTDYLARGNVAKMGWPERLEVIDEMPMTPTRKIIKGELVGRLA